MSRAKELIEKLEKNVKHSNDEWSAFKDPYWSGKSLGYEDSVKQIRSALPDIQREAIEKFIDSVCECECDEPEDVYLQIQGMARVREWLEEELAAYLNPDAKIQESTEGIERA